MKPFRYYLRVRYGECDAQKVVFNSRYSDYVDVSINEFLRAIGILADFVSGHLDFQLVKQTIEWKAPARFDQVLELSIMATRLGTTSFTLATEFRIADPGSIGHLRQRRTGHRDGGNRLRAGGCEDAHQDAASRPGPCRAAGRRARPGDGSCRIPL